MLKSAVVAVVTAGAALVSSQAQAGVHWSVGINLPVPVVGYAAPEPVYAPAPVYSSPAYAYPAYASPAYASPAYAPSAYAAPVYAAPVYAPAPVYRAPVVVYRSYSPYYYAPVVVYGPHRGHGWHRGWR